MNEAHIVLDQTRLRSHSLGSRSFEGNILNVSLTLKRLGKADSTIDGTRKILQRLACHCDLGDPLKVAEWIANHSGKGSYKANLVKAYNHYVQVNGLSWEKPHYKWQQQKPKIPTNEALDTIIERASRKYQAIFKLLRETGAMPYELSQVTLKDVDLDSSILNVRGFKGHASRSFKLKAETLGLLKWYLQKYQSFPKSEWISRAWRRLRDKVSLELQDPALKTIRLYDLRHFYGTMLYHRTKDILFTKQQMGHKKIETTLLYAQLLDLDSEDYHSATAKTVEEACKLIESGFQYVCEFEGVKLFRKPK
jgi:integrase